MAICVRGCASRRSNDRERRRTGTGAGAAHRRDPRLAKGLPPRSAGAGRARRDRSGHPGGIVRGADGPLGIGEDDAPQLDRRHRHADERLGACGGRRHRADERDPARLVAIADGGIHLPVLQFDAGPDRGGERGVAPSPHGPRTEGAHASRRRGFAPCRPFRPDGPHAAPAFRRAAAAGRHRPGHRGGSEDHRRGRAHRRPRPQERRGRARAPHHLERDAGKNHRDGDARSPRRRAREDPAAPRQGALDVTLAGLALRNAFLRNKTRAFLTILGTMVAALAFVFLRTVLAAWYASSDASAADRLVTRNAISITQFLPLSYRDRIANVEGVTKVTFSNWFGGVYKDKKNFFAQFAVDPKSALEVFSIRFVAGSKEDFLADRNSCIVGAGLAERFKFKVGDTIPLSSEIFPGDWRFKVAGIVEGTDDASIANTMYFQWQRLNEGLPAGIKDVVSVYTITVADAGRSPEVARKIDAMFANSDYETHTETERSFRLQFIQGSSAILYALEAVSGVILLIMALILGNTLAMGLRERTPELGAMRAIGFLPRHVGAISLAEGALLGLTGGALGVFFARPVLIGFGKALSSLGFLTGISFKPGTAALTVVCAAVIGALASAFPAWQAGRMQVVEALRRQE